MDNFSGLNVSTGTGEGAAYVPQFSKTDRAVNLLYQQQQQRQQAGYNDYLNNQRELDKEMANVRSADVPELRNLYDTQKQLHQQLLFNPKLQRDRNAYNQVEKAYQDANIKLVQGIHGSIETQNFDKVTNEDMLKNPDVYSDDARTLLSKAMQLPNSKRTQLGYNSVEPYLYQGGNYDWQKSIKDAQGTPQAIYGKETPSQDGLTFQTPTYQALANPARFQQSLLGDLAQRKAGKSAAFEYSQLTPQQIDAVNKSYEAIPQSEFDKWGIAKPNLDATNPNNAAEQYVSYLSKLHAISNLPTTGDVKTRNNEGSILALKNKYDTQQKLLENKLIAARKDNDQTQVNNSIDNLIDNQINYANSSFGNRTIPADPATLDKFKVDALKLEKDGKHIIGEWKDKEGNTQYTAPFTIDSYKAAMGKQYGGQSYFKGSSNSSQSTQKSYKYNGKTYSEEQLSKAAQASGMSLEDYKKELGLQ